VIVVVGLAFEARIAAGPGMRVICSGDGHNLAATLTHAVAQGCGGLISFGVAGGLDPQLRPGTCIIGSEVITERGRMTTDRQWSQRLLQALPNPVHGALVGVGAPVADAHSKRALHLKTGAVAVDMESHIVADVAATHGLPMAAIRVITDPAKRAIPNVALAAMRPNGTVDVLAVMRSLMQKPRDLVALLQTALDARAARATLREGRRLLGPRLGMPEPYTIGRDVAASTVRLVTAAAPDFSTYLPAAGALQSAE
jgi:hopanoid-associated phosphorylase